MLLAAMATPYVKSRDNTLTSTHMESALLLLPEAILERILVSTGSRKAELRYVCKAFSCAISKSATVLKIPREILRKHGSSALSSFPNAGQVIVDLSRGKALHLDNADAERLEDLDDATLVVSALDALAALRHPLTSLAVRHLTGPLPQLSAATLAYLNSCGLSELELQDDSIHRAASDGATNLLRPLPGQLPGRSLADSIRLRGAAMARFACSLPGLQRLSLCCAAFSASDVASLAVLTQLEALTLVGAMECGGPWTPCGETAARPPRAGQPGPAFAAAVAYKQLLAGPHRLRRLQLPMAIPAPVVVDQVFSLDSDDEDLDNDDEDSERDAYSVSRVGLPCGGERHGPSRFAEATSAEALGDRLLSGPGAPSVGACQEGYAAADAVCGDHGDWRFPPQLAELTIPLCFLNGRVFRAACAMHEIATRTALFNCGFGGAPAAEAKTGCSLRTLHVPCSPGYTVWAGSFLNDESDFASLSQLSSLESLHLTLELGASGRRALRRDRLRDCLRNLRELRRLKHLHISETCPPVSFAVRKNIGGKPNLLTWLLDDNHRLSGTCPSMPIMPQPGNQPFPIRPWLPYMALPGLPAASPGPASAFTLPPTAGPGPSLDCLLAHWPALETLVVCGQRAVRSSRGGQTRLVLPASLDELMDLRRQSRSVWY